MAKINKGTSFERKESLKNLGKSANGWTFGQKWLERRRWIQSGRTVLIKWRTVAEGATGKASQRGCKEGAWLGWSCNRKR